MILLEAALGEPACFARLSVLRQEIRADPLDERSKSGLRFLRRERVLGWPAQIRHLESQHGELRVSERAILEELRDAARHRHKQIAQPARSATAGDCWRQISWARFEKAPQHVTRDEAPIDERRKPGTQAPLAELYEHHRDVGIVLREVAADAERRIERLVDEPRNLGFISQIESRIDVRLERELPDERQAKRVDRGDRDIAETLAQITQPGCIHSQRAARLAEPLHDPLAHLRGRLSGESDRENVLRIDAGEKQVDISFHEDACFAGASRSLEHHVLGRIDGMRSRGPVDCRRWSFNHGLRTSHDHIFKWQQGFRHLRRNPSGTPPRMSRSCTQTHRRESAESCRPRCRSRPIRASPAHRGAPGRDPTVR